MSKLDHLLREIHNALEHYLCPTCGKCGTLETRRSCRCDKKKLENPMTVNRAALILEDLVGYHEGNARQTGCYGDDLKTINDAIAAEVDAAVRAAKSEPCVKCGHKQ